MFENLLCATLQSIFSYVLFITVLWVLFILISQLRKLNCKEKEQSAEKSHSMLVEDLEFKPECIWLQRNKGIYSHSFYNIKSFIPLGPSAYCIYFTIRNSFFSI